MTILPIWMPISLATPADSSARALNAELSLTLGVGCKGMTMRHDEGQKVGSSFIFRRDLFSR